MMNRRFVALGALAVLAACQQEPEAENGREIYLSDCAGCHGLAGKGDGVLAAALSPPPPDLTTIAARNGGLFPRLQVMATIDGLDRGAHFSDAMPEFGAGDMGEAVIVEEEEGVGTPIPTRLLALADYLEAIQS